MSQDYSKENAVEKPKLRAKRKLLTHSLFKALLYVGWVVASFYIAQQIVIFIVRFIYQVNPLILSVGEAMLSTIFSVIIYLLTMAIAVGVPWLVKKRRTSLKEVGIDRLPAWMDMILAPPAFIVYLVISVVLSAIATAFLPGFDVAQQQEVGFTSLNYRYEYLLAFFTLVVVAPIAEEVLFRGYLFGKLRKHLPLWLAVVATSATFGFVHGAWNVGLDTFALSIILCSLRVMTGRLWAPILLHMIKNAIAYYLLFINPSFFNTLGG